MNSDSPRCDADQKLAARLHELSQSADVQAVLKAGLPNSGPSLGEISKKGLATLKQCQHINQVVVP